MSGRLAIEKAREYALAASLKSWNDAVHGTTTHGTTMEHYLAGYAQGQADASKLLEGVVRQRDREPGEPQP